MTDRLDLVCAEITSCAFPSGTFDIVIAYGILHCLDSEDHVAIAVRQLKEWTTPGGYLLACAFNSRHQDLSAHPGFRPTLLSHDDYLMFFEEDAEWSVTLQSDADLHETHPHNGVPHTHSMTRIIARRAPT